MNDSLGALPPLVVRACFNRIETNPMTDDFLFLISALDSCMEGGRPKVESFFHLPLSTSRQSKLFFSCC